MKKGWSVTQTVIATILQAYALYFIYSLSDYIYSTMHMTTTGGIIVKREIGFWPLVKAYHFGYIIGLLTLYGGIALLYDKKNGWVVSVLTTLVLTSLMLVSGRNGIVSSDPLKLSASVNYLLAAAGFIALFVLLLQKPFRQKYQPTLANWLFIIGVIVLLVIDKMLFNK